MAGTLQALRQRCNGGANRSRAIGGSADTGSIAVLLILSLPVLLLLAGLVIDAGTLFFANSLAYTAADMASLAAVQDLDLESLAEGKRYILPEPAARDAEAWLATNILRNWPGLKVEDITAAVTVYNHEEGAPGRHSVSGRTLTNPTVCVEVSFPVRLRFVSAIVGTVRARAHADASVVPKDGH
ncbi:MAG: pilus assembly protein TadG-related protein [Chloroflexota bacterium]